MSAREIEFRAWHPDHGMSKFVSVGSDGWFAISDDDEVFNQDEGTLMQYTGIKDANGVKVFEGDVCYDGDGDIFVVAWSKVSAMFFLYFPGGLPDDAICDAIEPFKVIGNIHQHPELLEVSK